MKKIQYSFNYCIPDAVLEIMPSLEKFACREIDQYKPEYLWEMITLISLNTRNDQGETRTKAQYVKKIVPKYGQYLGFLLRYGIMESDNHYIPGEKCKAYWFAPKYYGRFQYRPIKSAWMIRRIEKNRVNLHKTKSHPEQIKYLNRITIDDGALAVINAMIDVNQHNAAMAQFEKIRSGMLYAIKDSTAGRLHTNVTNLLSLLRPFLRVNGKQLSNIDIKNSQPYFTIILLRDPKKAAQFAKSAKFATLLRSLDAVDSMDSKMFIYLVGTGKLYEFLMDNGYKGIRDSIKRKFFIVMYGSPIYHERMMESQIFERLFPSVFERLNLLKGTEKRGKNKFEKYHRVAILLQTLEVHAILDRVSKRIGRDRPDVIILTIHDSIMTGFLTNDIEYVHGVMIDELNDFVGEKPSLKIENAPENQNQEIPEPTEIEMKDNNYLHYDSQNLVTN